MNWYRFKTELIAWAVKTVAWVAVALVFTKTVAYYGGGETMWLAGGQFFGAHPWFMPAAMWALMALLLVSVYKALAVMRSDSRYGER